MPTPSFRETYLGDLRVECEHLASGTKIITDAPVIPLQYLPMCAALAVNAGLDKETAWKAITINPSNSTGIGDRVGSLEAGKDGDVVIWTADPMTTVGAESYITVVDGKVAYQA